MYHPNQGGVPDIYPLFLGEFFVDTLDPPLAFGMKLAEKVRFHLYFVLAHRVGHGAAVLDDVRHRLPAHLQATADLPQTHAFLMKDDDRFALVRTDHGTPLLLWKTCQGIAGSLRPPGEPEHKTHYYRTWCLPLSAA